LENLCLIGKVDGTAAHGGQLKKYLDSVCWSADVSARFQQQNCYCRQKITCSGDMDVDVTCDIRNQGQIL